jgi:Protein of unknown function (DUF3303)
MLFMIIEHFKHGDPVPIRERFARMGRMMPESVVYQSSWIDSQNARCFQITEAASEEALIPWINGWQDLIDFEIIPIVTSHEYWSHFS